MPDITEDDILNCWPVHHVGYLADILNGTYSVVDARADLAGLLGGRFDPRAQQNVQSDVCPVCGGDGVQNSGVRGPRPCIPCDGTGKRR